MNSINKGKSAFIDMRKFLSTSKLLLNNFRFSVVCNKVFKKHFNLGTLTKKLIKIFNRICGQQLMDKLIESTSNQY